MFVPARRRMRNSCPTWRALDEMDEPTWPASAVEELRDKRQIGLFDSELSDTTTTPTLPVAPVASNAQESTFEDVLEGSFDRMVAAAELESQRAPVLELQPEKAETPYFGADDDIPF